MKLMIRRRLFTAFNLFHSFSIFEKLGVINNKHDFKKFVHDVLNSYIIDNDELVNIVVG